MSGGSQSTSGVQQQFVDPYAYSMMYGPGAVQPIYGKKGRIKNQAEVDAARAGMQANFGTGGLLGTATDLYNSQGPAQWYGGPNTYAPTQENPTADAGTVPGSQVPGNTTYAPFNPMQNTAIQQAGSYLGSPASLAGYDALNRAGSWMMDPSNAPGPIDFGAVMRSVAGTIPGGGYGYSGPGAPNAPSQPGFSWSGPPQLSDIGAGEVPNASGGRTGSTGIDYGNTARELLGPGGSNPFVNKPEFSWGGAPSIDPITASAIPSASGASAGSAGINYRNAADQVLSGEVNNPYLQQMADDQSRRSMRTFNEQILPTLSTGAQAAGQYGGSANAKIYANAGRDLGADIHGANIGLFGNAYETAQGRKAQMANSLAGYDTQRDVASAQMATQASIANQDAALRRELANRDFALQAGDLGLRGASAKGNYDLGYSNLGSSNFMADLDRRTGLVAQLSGQDTQRAIAGDSTRTQASIANQRTGLDRAMANRDFALQSGDLGLRGATAEGNYNLGYGNLGLGYAGLGRDYAGLDLDYARLNEGATMGRYGLGLDAARAQGDYGLGRYGALGNSMATGAGMTADAAGIPLNNMQSLFGLGSLLQGDYQSQLDAARQRWDFGQQAPWEAANRYAGLVFPGAGFGGAQTSNQTTSSQLGAGQIIGGAAMMGMGALGGGGMFGASGAFGEGGRWGG